MANVLYSRCCAGGYRYQGGIWPVRCPQCGKKCEDWTVATVDDPAKPFELTPEDARLLHAMNVDPEVVEEV